MKEVRPENSGRGNWYLNCLRACYVIDSKDFKHASAFGHRAHSPPGYPATAKVYVTNT